MTEEQAIEVYQEAAQLPTKQDAQELIRRASDMAGELSEIIERKKLYAMIRDKKYIQVEGWQTAGALRGLMARSKELRVNEDGSVLAEAEVVRIRDGAIVSHATARCGSEGDGEWAKRTLEVRASMAQTRAVGKAFRNVLSWVIVLSGYEPTPAEEMPHEEKGTSGSTPRTSPKASKTPVEPPKGGDAPVMPTPEQYSAFWQMCGKRLGTQIGPETKAAVESVIGCTMEEWLASGKTLRQAWSSVAVNAR